MICPTCQQSIACPACASDLPSTQPAVPVPLTPYNEKYTELIYAVCKKYPGETRHQTALRYIRQAESHTGIEKAVNAHGIGEAKP